MKILYVLVSLLAISCGSEIEQIDVPTTTNTEAHVKFCTGLSVTGTSGEPLDIGLIVGEPPIFLTAKTGECSPNLNSECPSIPFGKAPYIVIEIATGRQLFSGVALIRENRDVLFAYRRFNADVTGVSYSHLLPNWKCENVDPYLMP